MIRASQITVYTTSTQGRLAVDITFGDTTCAAYYKVDRRWSINNEGGKWTASATLPDGTLLFCDKDLAQHIHRDTLTTELADIMNVYNYAETKGESK